MKISTVIYRDADVGSLELCVTLDTGHFYTKELNVKNAAQHAALLSAFVARNTKAE